MIGRGLLAASAIGVALAGVAGCGSPHPPPIAHAERPLPPLHLSPLASLVPAAGLRWMITVRPRELYASSDLLPAIERITPEQRLDAFTASTGVDLRTLPEAIVAGFDRATMYLWRSATDGATAERHFRARLITDLTRSELRPDLTMTAGRIGGHRETMVSLGNAAVIGVAVGDETPARAAAAYGLGKLSRSPSALVGAPLAEVAGADADAPARAFAAGPFSPNEHGGAHGLLAGATAISGAIRPAPRGGLSVTIRVAGPWDDDAPRAARALLATWADLVESPLGHLADLQAPRSPPRVTTTRAQLTLEVELDGPALGRGIAAALDAQISEILDVVPTPPPAPPH